MTEAVVLALVGCVLEAMRRLFARIDNLEKRLSEAEAAITREAKQRGRVERLLERVCTGYEAVRRELLKVARALRNGESVSESQLREIEATPDIQQILKAPTD